MADAAREMIEYMGQELSRILAGSCQHCYTVAAVAARGLTPKLTETDGGDSLAEVDALGVVEQRLAHLVPELALRGEPMG